MENLYSQDIKVLSSQTDFNAQVGLIQSLQYFQDNMSEFFENIKCDGVRLIKNCNAFWVMTKTKIRINKNINWLDLIKITSKVSKLSNIRLNLSSNIINDNCVAMECIQEICAMDSNTRKLRLINSINDFPRNLDVAQPISNLEFDKFDFNLNDEDFVESVKVKALNTDYFGHTNNVEYVKMMYNLCARNFLQSIKVNEFEIHYLKESKESDELKLYKRKEKNKLYFEIKKENDSITKSIIKFDYLQ